MKYIVQRLRFLCWGNNIKCIREWRKLDLVLHLGPHIILIFLWHLRYISQKFRYTCLESVFIPSFHNP
jgi:hypothetical protein